MYSKKIGVNKMIDRFFLANHIGALSAATVVEISRLETFDEELHA
jgi:hypothetical protein